MTVARHIVLLWPLACFLGACTSEQAESSAVAKDENLIYVNSNQKLGYYKASMVRAGNEVLLWLHLSSPNPNSNSPIERSSEINARILCDVQKIKFLRTADGEGVTVDEFMDGRFESPQPDSLLALIIQDACKKKTE